MASSAYLDIYRGEPLFHIVVVKQDVEGGGGMLVGQKVVSTKSSSKFRPPDKARFLLLPLSNINHQEIVKFSHHSSHLALISSLLSSLSVFVSKRGIEIASKINCYSPKYFASILSSKAPTMKILALSLRSSLLRQ